MNAYMHISLLIKVTEKKLSVSLHQDIVHPVIIAMQSMQVIFYFSSAAKKDLITQ